MDEHLDKSKFGLKIISNNPIIVKTERISDVEIKKTAFDIEGRIL